MKRKKRSTEKNSIMKKPSVNILLTSLIILSFMIPSGCIESNNEDSEEDYFIVKDMYHRDVAIPNEINHLVAIGAQALRFVSYLDCGDKIIATELREGPNFNAKSYMYANPEYAEMNTLALSALTDMESILSLDPKPDLIIMGEATSNWQPQFDILDAAGIPVFGIMDVTFFDDLFDIQIRLLGTVLQKEHRAEELINYVHDTIDDLSQRVSDIKDEDKPTVYVGATAWAGIRPFEYSTSNYGPFRLLDANNVITRDMTAASESPVGFELEHILDLDPEYVFIEATGYTMVKDAYNEEERKTVFDSMSAFHNGSQDEWDVYMTVPFIWYFMNFDNILVSAYYIGTVIYPEEFADITITEKANEIYTNFVGEEVFEEMNQWFKNDRNCYITGRALL
jgi:iron complex transport system substrate-binding protein